MVQHHIQWIMCEKFQNRWRLHCTFNLGNFHTGTSMAKLYKWVPVWMAKVAFVPNLCQQWSFMQSTCHTKRDSCNHHNWLHDHFYAVVKIPWILLIYTRPLQAMSYMRYTYMTLVIHHTPTHMVLIHTHIAHPVHSGINITAWYKSKQMQTLFTNSVQWQIFFLRCWCMEI